MAGLLNAFSSGFVDGARAGALMDATWAAQDERERAEKDRQQLEADMQEFADLSEKNSGAVMTTPEGQQVAGKVLMGNPAVRKAVNSNSGHEFAGIIKNPKAEDEYYLAVRTPEGQVRPVTVGREKGGPHSSTILRSSFLLALLRPDTWRSCQPELWPAPHSS